MEGTREEVMAQVIPDEQILEAALSTIAEKGYAGATTRAIATTAGINEVTIFRRFGSKKQLLMAAVEQEAENLVAAGIEYSGDLEADLARVVRFYHELMQSRGHVLLMLLSEVPRQPELMEIMETPFAIVRKITAILARYQEEGALVQEPPTSAFASLVGPLFLSGIVRFGEPELELEAFDPVAHVRRYLQGRARA